MLVDGKIAYAIEEERLSREKRTRKFPFKGVQEILNNYKITLEDIDFIAVGWNPAINLENFNSSLSEGRSRFIGEYFYSIINNLMRFTEEAGDISEQIISLKSGKKIHIYFVRHHLCHAANYFLSPFKDSSILTIDAFGEKETVTFSKGNKNKISKIWKQEYPHSLGSFYSAFTEFLGFEPQNDEWKLMGASAYGDRNRYYKKLKKTFIILKEGFELNLRYFNHYQFHRPKLFTENLEKLLGLKFNKPNKNLTKNYFDLAASVQKCFEEIYLSLIKQIYKKNKSKNLVLSGGCALNSLANGKVVKNTRFKNIFIPPVPDDSGVSIGAAQYIYHNVKDFKNRYFMSNNYLGYKASEKEIIKELKLLKLNYLRIDNITAHAAKKISSGKIIGWYQGAVEFGDRALGNRSILADPRDPKVKDKINQMIKYRESFRPFAPAVLEEKAKEYFKGSSKTPFMEKIFLIKKSKIKIIPGVVHVDNTGRIQTVTKKQNKKFYNLVKEFEKITKVPILLNTSLNIKGDPIACKPIDAIKTFFSSGLDCLYLENFFIQKKDD